MQLKERFDQGGLKMLAKLEKVLLTGEMETAVVDQYPELNQRSLEVQLNMFKLQYPYKTTSEATAILRNQLPEVRGLFTQVEALVRLLMVVPAASAEAERSFSALRRLKTWLRSTMVQMRLNNVAVCHIHKEILDEVSKRKICQEFILANEYRKHVFGSFKPQDRFPSQFSPQSWCVESASMEVCDTILGHAKERFSFTKHLISATLLQGDKFQQYNSQFPEAALNTTMEAYPLLNKSKLKTELSLIYSNDEFKSCSGAVALYQLFMGNNLQDTFSETVALLKIIITTPMTTAESERCFSTLKRIKTFFRNTMSQDRLNALAMLSMEKKLVKDIPDFNHRVIEKFASLKERRAKFMYKK
ncbi:hypothetical protein SKAU_G00247430 [Synaphobranchus kaupii]|uniref:HAT C-terminal dimerisation domain-containing protein n=1 Tax=Synaphobranchus kaupii TaxID=118154 RepID=A0A9Q1IRB5_SYNKA|nr:hypothetical protein SKAU_G00247430 [Synaphobranchus kaupii]